MAGKAPRALPQGVAEPLSAAEQAHIDSGGAASLPAAEPVAETAPVSDAAPSAPSGAEPVDPAVDREAATPVDDTSGADMRPKFVPHAALHEERELRKAAERRAQLLEERTNLVLEAMRAGAPAAAAPAAAAPAAAPLPDFDKDPNGHIRGVLRQQEELLRTLTAVAVNQQQAGRQAAAVTEARERIAALEQDFARETPDYGEARRFTIEARDRQLVAIGHRDPAERQRIVGHEARMIAENAMRMGLNPAVAAYELAKSMGYRKPAAAAAPAARIANATAGQRQAGALASMRGSGPAPLNVNRLLELSDAEFARAIGTPEGRALLGT